MSVETDDAVAKQPETFREFRARIRKAFTAELAIDRTGIPMRQAPVRAKAAAWATILGLYVLGWGQGTVTALVYLLGWQDVPAARPAVPVDDEVMRLLRDVALVLVALALIWAFRQYAGASVRPARWATNLRTLPAAYVASFLGFWALNLLSSVFGFTQNTFEAPSFDSPAQAFVNIVSDGMAGPTEELALMAVVVVALRATGHSWTVVCIAAAIVRVPFHLYYGWGSIGLAIWAVLIVLLYKRTGAIIAIILEHASFNMLNHVPYNLGGFVKVALVVVGIIILGRALNRASQTARRS